MKRIVLLIAIVLFSCKNKEEDKKDVSNQFSNTEVHKNKDIDSLRQQGFEVYSEYNFFKFSGKVLRKRDNADYPLLAVKKEGESLKLVSLLYEGRNIIRKIDGQGMESVWQIAASEELFVSNFIIRYEKNRIVVFDIRRYQKIDKSLKNFYLNAVYYIYEDNVTKYSQSGFGKRLLNSIDEVDISTKEEDLSKLFTGDSELVIENFKGKNGRKGIFSPLANYLMIPQ